MAEHELERYWKTVVNTIQDGIIIVDKQGTIVSVNRALENITGFSKRELVGEKCTLLDCNICKRALQKQGEHWCSLFESGRLATRKCICRRKDGSEFYALKNASLLHDDHGDVIGAVETLTDITKIIEKDNQIAAYQRELESENGFHGLIGSSPGMQQLYDLIANAAHSDAPVIIFGESGTGKELVALGLHENSPRSGGRLSRSTAPPSTKTCWKASCSATSKAPSPERTRTGSAV
jgi:two-component system response regulator HydG